MMAGAKFAITGVGSLPHKDEAEAYGFVQKYCPDVPFVVQFPAKGRFGEMIYEPFESAPELIETKSRRAIRKGALDEAKVWAETNSGVRNIVHTFLKHEPPEGARIVKTQLVGPYTLLTQIEHTGIPLLYEEDGRALVREILLKHIRAEADLLKKGRGEVLFVLDEPVLGFLKKKDLLAARTTAKEVFAELRASGVTSGVHCCAALPGKTAAIVLRDLDVDVISLAIAPMQNLEQSIDPDFVREHLEKGRKFIWGAVPTGNGGDVNKIVDRFKDEIFKIDYPRTQLAEQSLLSPACGLGLLNAEKAERIFKTLQVLRNELCAAL